MKTKLMRKRFDYFEAVVRDKEVKEQTIRKYICDINRFIRFVNDDRVEVDKKLVVSYKEYLLNKYKAATVTSYLISLNNFFKILDISELCVKLPRVQKRYSLDRVMSMEDYNKLLSYTILHNKDKYYCIMRTLASTGIRVGELELITCESLQYNMASVTKKNKVREIYYTDELCSLLKEYIADREIVTGPIFLGENENPLDKSSIWKTLKSIARKCGVNPEVVYPHSFRHLFARTYMQQIGGITELADLLGHSSLETTRIYTMGTKEEKRNAMSTLGL